MVKQSILSDKQRGLLDYLIEKARLPKSEIPTIQHLSSDLGISTACLREQMELAKNLGIIATQPRKGIEIREYQFKPAVEKSLYYAIGLDKKYFHQFSELRNHLEKAFFVESAEALTEENIDELMGFVRKAQSKLSSFPIQIPHQEHRDYHLSIYKIHNNTFLLGILESYWDMYEQAGLDTYNDLSYLVNVWNYHHSILEKIKNKDFEGAFSLLIAHMELIDERGLS